MPRSHGRVRGRSMVAVGALVVAASAVGVGGAGSAAALSPTFYAYASGTGTPPGCPTEDTPTDGCSLQTALNSANDGGDTVLLATPGSGGHYVSASNTINWTLNTMSTSAADPVFIQPAPGVADPTLDGQAGEGPNAPDAPILKINDAGSVTITGVTFTGGSNLSGNGGAIDTGDGTAGGTVAIDDSTFTNNTALDGGVIDNGDGNGGSGTVSILDSTFAGNTNAGDGSVIDNGDNGGSGTVSVVDSTFSNNSSAFGGAIDNGDGSGSGTLAVADSTFIGDAGGAITNGRLGGSGSKTVAVAGDLFSEACAQTAGTWDDGGYNVGGDSSCFKDGPSDVISGNVSNLGTLQDNGGPTQTIAPWVSNPAIGRVPAHTTVTLNGASVQLCPRTDQRGVSNAAGQQCSAGAVSRGTLFAYADGGDGSDGCPASTTTSLGCSLDLALAVTVPGDTVLLGTAGATASYQGNWTVTTAGTGLGAPVTIRPASGVIHPILDGKGSNGPKGPILDLTDGVSVTITGVTFTDGDNTSSNGGAIDTGDGSAGGMVSIADSTFSSNITTGNGGAIDSGDDHGSGALSIVDSTFTGNSTSKSGGAIDNGENGGSETLSVSGSSFANNSAQSDGGAIDSADFGGWGALAVADSTFTDNTVTGYDGGAIDSGDDGGSATATVSDSTFSGNTAQDDGGGIDSGDFGGSGILVASGSTFSANMASSNGGAIDSGDNGGASTATVSTSTFSANTATTDGGAIDSGDRSASGTSRVRASTFTGDKAIDGGAIDTADNGGHGDLTVRVSTFSGNVAVSGGDGGAIDNADHTASGTMSVSGTTFTGNTTDNDGATIDNGDEGGTGSAYLAGDLFNGSCDQAAGSWHDAGFNAGTNSSCLGSTPPASDRTSSAVAGLGTLRTYGGSTATVPLAWNNPGLRLIPSSTTVNLNGSSVGLCPRTDQRGLTSTTGTPCDAGAMQSAADTLTAAASPSTTTVGKTVTLSARITTSSGLPASVPTPSGQIVFTLGSKLICKTSTFSGSTGTAVAGSCKTKKLAKGTDHLTATYRSADGYATSTRKFTAHVHPVKKKKKKKH